MKSIVKNQTPDNFENWKLLANDNWSPSYDGLPTQLKSDLHKALLIEQGWVCCYCGQKIDLLDSHIEHFRPQSLRPDLALCYENLHASCIRKTKPGIPLHCGHAKGNSFDEEQHISPLDQNCEQRFIFTFIGDISQKTPTDENAKYMIGLLHLNSSALCNLRKAALMDIFDPDFIASATDTELQKLVDSFRQRDVEGHVQNLGHVVARYAEQLLGVA